MLMLTNAVNASSPALFPNRQPTIAVRPSPRLRRSSCCSQHVVAVRGDLRAIAETARDPLLFVEADEEFGGRRSCACIDTQAASPLIVRRKLWPGGSMGGIRTIRTAALLVLSAALLLGISGCIESNYDISQDAPPQLPWDSGLFRTKDQKDVTILRRADGYHIADSDSSAEMRLFRWEGYSGYVFQARNWDKSDATTAFQYGFVKREGESWTFFALPGDPLQKFPPRLSEITHERSDQLVVDEDANTPGVINIIVQNSDELMEIQTLTPAN
jgi:hypothetical protein